MILFDIFAAAIMNDERIVIIEGKDDYAECIDIIDTFKNMN